MRNLEKTLKDYDGQEKNVFYASDFQQIKELAEIQGGAQRPILCDMGRAKTWIHDGVQGREKEIQEKIQALDADQRDRLLKFFDVVIASKEGRATDGDIIANILALPETDIRAFTDIMLLMQGR